MGKISYAELKINYVSDNIFMSNLKYKNAKNESFRINH